MDSASTTPNIIATLCEIRTTLQDALNVAKHFERKLIGPRPSDDGPNAKTPDADNVTGIVADIRILSNQLHKQIDAHHAILGNSELQPTGLAQIGRASYS